MRLLLCALLITSNAIACNYESNDLIQYGGSIESVRVIDKKVYPYVEDTRICTMHIESRVKVNGIHQKENIYSVQMYQRTKLVLMQRVVQSQ